MSGYNYPMGISGQPGQQMAQQVYNQAAEPAAQAGIIQRTKIVVENCHEILTALHNFADQYVGIRDNEKNAASPAPVPNGAVEELHDSSMYLLHRLNTLSARLSVL